MEKVLLKHLVPPYDPERAVEYDYDNTRSVSILDEEGLRLLLGDGGRYGPPNLVVERGVNCWRILVAKDDGDTDIVIEIEDSGRMTAIRDFGGELLYDTEDS